MFKLTLRSLPFVLALCALSACSNNQPKPGSTAKDPQSAYAEARVFFDDGVWDSAIEVYEQLEARFPYGRYAQQAQLDTAYAHYRMRDVEATIADADRFIRQHPNHPNVDYAYYLKALAYQNAGTQGIFSFLPEQPLAERDAKSISNAFETYKIILNRYPESRYAADAHTQMQILLEALAVHELNAARYYLKRRSPIAAINRAQSIVQKYATASVTEEALSIMVQGYATLGLNDLRKDAERVLRANYPQSRFLAQN